MIFTDSPYYPYIKRVRRMIGDEDNPVPSLKVYATLAGTANTNTAPRLIVQYTAPSGNTVSAQQLILRDKNGHTADQVFDLTAYTTLRDLAVALDQTTFGDATLNVAFLFHPVRNQNPTDLAPTNMLLNAVPQVAYQRHWLSDEDIVDEVDGACTSHNTDYVINPANATQTVTGTHGQPTMPYPVMTEYPYPALARNNQNRWPVPANEAYFVCMLTASQCLERVAVRFAKIPSVQLEGASISRDQVTMELRTSAQELLDKYDELYGRSGLSVRVSDLNRFSSSLGVMSEIPEVNPGYMSGNYTLARWLSPMIPNLVQPVTDTNARAYGGMGTLLVDQPTLALNSPLQNSQ